MPRSIEQLTELEALLGKVREQGAGIQELLAQANAATELVQALPPAFGRVLDQISMRLSSAADFVGESCSFSQAELLDALEQWLAKARAKLESAG